MKAWTDFLRGTVLKVYYPFLMLLGAFMKGKRAQLQSHVIRLNNTLVKKNIYSVSKILLLLPHCIQNSQCDIRLTFDLFKCKRCGRCKIKDLIELAQRSGIAISIATGGTIARKVVKEIRPDAIVAVACERDLSSGIVDTYPIPVLGVENQRPFGPCIDTTVNLDKVKEAVEWFLRNRIQEQRQ